MPYNQSFQLKFGVNDGKHFLPAVPARVFIVSPEKSTRHTRVPYHLTDMFYL